MATMTKFTPEEDAAARRMEEYVKRRRTTDVKDLIQTIMSSPLENALPLEIDGYHSLKSYEGKPLDVLSLIMLNATRQAIAGDKEARTFLMKYGGYNPVEKKEDAADRVMIVNDLSDPAVEAEYREAMERKRQEAKERAMARKAADRVGGP